MLEVIGNYDGKTYRIATDERYAVDRFDGIAFHIIGEHTEPDEDTEWTGYEVSTGMVDAVMVGDDRVWVVDPSDLTKLDDGASCASCGQIGCTADGRDSE